VVGATATVVAGTFPDVGGAVDAGSDETGSEEGEIDEEDELGAGEPPFPPDDEQDVRRTSSAARRTCSAGAARPPGRRVPLLPIGACVPGAVGQDTSGGDRHAGSRSGSAGTDALPADRRRRQCGHLGSKLGCPSSLGRPLPEDG